MPATALSTDLYELTMIAGYYAAGIEQARATFELYVRDLPDHRAFLVAAGLEQALDYLERLRFEREEIAYLRSLPGLRDAPAALFEEFLPRFRFTGDVWAIEEGTPLFHHEPFLRVTAPLAEAQLVETALLAIITFQTSIATKAVRVVEAARGRPVVEFGSRRAHGVEAAFYAARAAYLGGCEATSNVEAGYRFGIPVSGTMAHSWVMAFGDEVEAFRRYQQLFGDRAIFLIDTYDTVEAARKIVRAGLRPVAVRLDSGDTAALSRAVRRILDEGGLARTTIFASGDLDEYKIDALLEQGAPIDGFGVGTALATSKDAPALGGVYKLVSIERGGHVQPTLKVSPGKPSYPCAKQVWRLFRDGTADGDLLGESGEAGPPGASSLLAKAMAAGKRVAASPPLAALRARCGDRLRALPPGVRRLRDPEPYRVEVTERLDRLTRRMAAEHP